MASPLAKDLGVVGTKNPKEMLRSGVMYQDGNLVQAHITVSALGVNLPGNRGTVALHRSNKEIEGVARASKT